MSKRISAQDIYQRLRAMILDFDLYPGTRFTEQELADTFNVSRTPVRQALQQLAAEGHIKILPKQGCFIPPVDVEAISQYYDVRVALEAMAVDLACHHMAEEDLQKLADDWNPKNRRQTGKVTGHVSLVEESFHTQLAKGSGNKILEKYLADVNDHIRIIRRLGFPDETSIVETYEEHFEICQLLLNRKCEQAKEAIVTHIRKSQNIARNVTLSQLEKHRKQPAKRKKMVRKRAAKKI